MSSAYGWVINEKIETFEDLPENLVLSKTEEPIVFDIFREDIDFEYLFKIFEEVIEEGQTYPQDSTDRQSFRSYFLSHYCFVFRLSSNNQTIGGFYIKPNFPGRSAHLANCGLIVKMEYRDKGLGHLMMERVVRMAKQLPYEALYTNLVYATNERSIKVCKKYGFTEVGRLPRAGNMKGLGFVDALQLYLRLK